MNNNVIDSKYCSNCKKFIIGVDSNGNFVPAPQLSCPFCGNSLKYPLVSTDAEEFDNEVIKSIDKSQMVIGVTNPSLSERITNFVDVHDYRNTVRECVNKISEGLYKQAIAENTSIDKLNDKIDVIMTALGLEQEEDSTAKTEDTVADKELELDVQSNSEEDAEVDVPNDNDELQQQDDKTEGVGEGLSSKKNKYTIEFSLNAKYKDWYSKIANNKLGFDTFNDLMTFLTQGLIPVNYKDLEMVEKRNKEGKHSLVNTIYYKIYNNDVDGMTEYTSL